MATSLDIRLAALRFAIDAIGHEIGDFEFEDGIGANTYIDRAKDFEKYLTENNPDTLSAIKQR